MAAQTFQLVMRTGPSPGKTFTLSKPEMYIGRDMNNDIVINDAEVSRRHARLVLQSGQYVYEDMGSTNGSFLDDRRLTSPHLLSPGEVIKLGDNVSLAFEAVQFDPEATMVAAPGPEAVPAPTPVSPEFEEFQSPGYPGESPGPVVSPGREKKGSKTWLVAGLGCLVLVVCVIIPLLALWYIDANALWCDFFPFIPGC